MAGMDISGAFSESATQAGKITAPFAVGGGLRIPPWVWFAAAVIAAIIVWQETK